MWLCYSRAMAPLRDLELTIQSRYPFVAVETSEEDPWFMGVLISCAPESRRALALAQLMVPWQG